MNTSLINKTEMKSHRVIRVIEKLEAKGLLDRKYTLPSWIKSSVFCC